MKARRSILIQLLALALAVAMTAVAIPLFRGSLNGAGAEPVIGVLPLLTMIAVLAATFGVIRGRSVPAVGIFRAFAASAVLLTMEQGFMLGAAVSQVAFSIRFGFAIIFGLLVSVAPILTRVEQNPWIGVRTPWTLSSRRVWRETHRTTGKLWFFGGILGSTLALFGAPILLVIVYLASLTLAPIAISYSVWRRMGRP